ncbi:serine/arginine-rich splicing factor 7-like isoform X1 [Dermacentor andersoni]|uniref:serine/arginine-rich splicing factor 7-like isoform X1 n=3 Tax=Dermacentor andersoni TaxID=34620 RepID=UPI0021550C3E|nr:serine/arginine-rich splicing factor 7-like isoform X1 [Dermacentor andersoni]XP_050040560.1 serine/arginine-rich splicing factor 7-like isoform X1 [Dermacentor andersoni]
MSSRDSPQMARYRDTCPIDCKVYVGELGNSGTKHELEEAFGYYGPLRNVWVARSPPGFAFVEFEDPRDARDAVRALDGKMLCGRRVRVELSTGKSRNSYRGSSRPFQPTDRCYDCGERGHYARDCRVYSRRNSSRRSRSRSRSRSFSPRRGGGGGGGGRSRSLSRSPRRSPPAGSRSRSRSRSPIAKRGRSGSKSPSRRDSRNGNLD